MNCYLLLRDPDIGLITIFIFLVILILLLLFYGIPGTNNNIKEAYRSRSR